MAEAKAADTASSDGTSGDAPDDAQNVKAKSSFFHDVNPEMDCQTAFERRLPYAGGESNLTVSELTPQEVIDRELANSMVSKRPEKKMAQECYRIVPRANPRGIVQLCEICSRNAFLCCSGCNLTYYCSWSHRRMDSLHSLLCKRLMILRWPNPHMDNTDHRKRLVAQKLLVMEKLLEDLVVQSYVHLYRGNYSHAIGALLQSIKYVTRVFGPSYDDLQQIALHTAMSEAQVGLGKHGAAEKSLKNALIRLCKAEEANDYEPPTALPLNYARAQVCRMQGILHFAAKNYDDAIFYFADCIYNASEAASPTDVRTSTGYYYLGRTFLKKGRTSEGYALFSFCLELWQKYLKEVLMSATANSYKTTFVKSTQHRPVSMFLEVDATQQFQEILGLSNEEEHPEIICRATVCQGILMYFNKNYTEAREYAIRAGKLEPRENDSELYQLCKHLEKHAARMEFSDVN